MLCGSREFIEKAKKWRKRLGGAQRQLGIAAAAGLYALKNNVARLAEDHENARLLAELLRGAGIAVENTPDMTNMVFFPLGEGDVSDEEFEKRCLDRGMLIHMVSPRRARFVTHMDVDREDVERAAAIVAEGRARSGRRAARRRGRGGRALQRGLRERADSQGRRD